MRSAPFLKLGLVALVIAVLAGTAFATNGYFSHGVGMKAKAAGGASAAWPQDALSGANNPAAPAFLGDRFDVGLDLVRPDRGGGITGNTGGDAVDGDYDANGKSNFFLPEFGYNRAYRDHMAVGFAIFAAGYMNTSYTTTIPLFGTSKAGADLMQIFLLPYVAYKVNEKHSIGFGLNIAWQIFEAAGLEDFTAVTPEDSTEGVFSIYPASVTNNGHESSAGLGITLGYMGRVHDQVDIGLVYRSRTYMGRFKKYQGLFAEEGDFDIPPSLAGGIAVRVDPRVTLAFDVQHIWFSQIKSLNNPLLPNFTEARLGEVDGAGFGWQDVTAFKFGAAFEASDKVRLLGGYNYGAQPIPESEALFNMLMPGVVEHHITLGASVLAWRSMEITLAYMHALDSTIEGSGSIPETMGGGESDLRMSGNSLGVAVGWDF